MRLLLILLPLALIFTSCSLLNRKAIEDDDIDIDKLGSTNSKPIDETASDKDVKVYGYVKAEKDHSSVVIFIRNISDKPILLSKNDFLFRCTYTRSGTVVDFSGHVLSAFNDDIREFYLLHPNRDDPPSDSLNFSYLYEIKDLNIKDLEICIITTYRFDINEAEGTKNYLNINNKTIIKTFKIPEIKNSSDKTRTYEF